MVEGAKPVFVPKVQPMRLCFTQNTFIQIKVQFENVFNELRWSNRSE
jgi:hypothetical protein